MCYVPFCQGCIGYCVRYFTYFPYVRNAILYRMNDLNSQIQLLSINEGIDGKNS